MGLNEKIDDFLSEEYSYECYSCGSVVSIHLSRGEYDYSNRVISFDSTNGDVLFVKNYGSLVTGIIDILNNHFGRSISVDECVRKTNVDQIAYMREYLNIHERLSDGTIPKEQANDALSTLNSRYQYVSTIGSITKNDLSETLEKEWLSSSAFC